MSDLEYTVENRFPVTLENIVDGRGCPSEFPIELRVTSPGHGDTIARQLEYRMRLAIYEAVDEFDEEIERRGPEAHRDRDELLLDEIGEYLPEDVLADLERGQGDLLDHARECVDEHDRDESIPGSVPKRCQSGDRELLDDLWDLADEWHERHVVLRASAEVDEDYAVAEERRERLEDLQAVLEHHE